MEFNSTVQNPSSQSEEKRNVLGEYDFVSSRLLYYPQMGFSLRNELSQWFDRYQKKSAFTCPNWENFEDPSQLTYFKFVHEKLERLYLIQGLFEMTRNSRYYNELSPEWIEKLRLLYSPQVYFVHAMQMMIAYVGQMAPTSQIASACAFQAANEEIRIQTISENMELVFSCFKTASGNAKNTWVSDHRYQPLRKLIEEALIVFDWGQAFVALNLCIKPLIDELFLNQLSMQSLFNNDHLTAKVCLSEYRESEWQLAWSTELMKMVLSQNPDFQKDVAVWVQDWTQKTIEALTPLIELFDYSQVTTTELAQAHFEKMSRLDFFKELRL